MLQLAFRTMHGGRPMTNTVLPSSVACMRYSRMVREKVWTMLQMLLAGTDNNAQWPGLPPMAVPPVPPLPLSPTAKPPLPLKSPELSSPPLPTLPLPSPPSPPAPPTTALFPETRVRVKMTTDRRTHDEATIAKALQLLDKTESKTGRQRWTFNLVVSVTTGGRPASCRR